MKIGYARVSTDDQNLALQFDVLQVEGCGRVFQDTASRARPDRKGLANALNTCAAGDVLTVWKLDRLGRSLLDLVGQRHNDAHWHSLSPQPTKPSLATSEPST